MEKTQLILEAVKRLMQVVEDIRTLADSVQSVCDLVTDSLEVKAPKLTDKPKAKEEPKFTLEQVRAVLADKSRNGHTKEVRAIIEKFGADRLSEIDPKDYGALLKDAEVL